MLFEPDRHEDLTDATWDPDRAASTIREIIDDTVASHDDGIWPFHPRETGSGRSTVLYHGSAGVLCALAHLSDAGRSVDGLDIVDALQAARDRYRRHPPRGQHSPALLTGAGGILLTLYARTGEAKVADRLLEQVRANRNTPADEFMWGAPGTMAAAHQMVEWTDDEKWKEAFRDSADALWERWWYDDRLGCHMWTQQFTGKRVRWIGACHGQVGNLDALLRGRSLFDERRRETLLSRTETVLEALAVEEDGCVNWPAVPSESEPRMVQWCHGATGIVLALAQVPAGRSEVVDDYLERAADLVWSAGPLTKGHNLCHGTAGSGFAMLKLWARTGDAEWLERARRFAMHAIDQYHRIYNEWNNGWYSLYTGDLGLAVFLQACLEEEAAVPGLDHWPRTT